MSYAASSKHARSVTGMFLAEIAAEFHRLVEPSLVPIYAAHQSRPDTPTQVGTGFLVSHDSRPVLVTAKHTLRGITLQENPGDKAVHLNGRWVNIGDGNRSVVEPQGRDLALAYMDEFGVDRCLAHSQLAPKARVPRVVTIGGFLARDFKRSGGTLRPAPRIYSNVGVAVGVGLVGLRYPKRHNIDTKTGSAAVTPIPSGMSGGPMLDTIELLKGAVSVVGVFTEQGDGQARGEDADVLQATLASL